MQRWNDLGQSCHSLLACCHKNLHNGHLRISGQAPDKLVFKDGQGNNLHRLHELEVAGWLDYWIGWTGQLEDSHQHRSAQSALTPEDGPLVAEPQVTS